MVKIIEQIRSEFLISNAKYNLLLKVLLHENLS